MIETRQLTINITMQYWSRPLGPDLAGGGGGCRSPGQDTHPLPEPEHTLPPSIRASPTLWTDTCKNITFPHTM